MKLEQEAENRRYEQKANEHFAESDERIRLLQRMAAQFPEEIRQSRDALESGKTINGPQFLGVANFGYPTAPARPLTKVWVIARIDSIGVVTHVECRGEHDAAVAPTDEALIATTIKSWRFRPKRIDGQPVACLNIFPVMSDGGQFYVSSPKELQ